MIQMQITLPENVMEMIRSEAMQCGVTPNVLARLQLCQIHGTPQTDAASKSYIVKIKNCREIEAYVEERGFGDLSIFLNKAAEWYMKKFHLSAVQKAAFDKNIKK